MYINVCVREKLQYFSFFVNLRGQSGVQKIKLKTKLQFLALNIHTNNFKKPNGLFHLIIVN
jgi:hypothetical protein